MTSERPIVRQATGMVTMTGHTARVEQLWREFFLDPSGWVDNRADKVISSHQRELFGYSSFMWMFLS